jgi:hypothetical protein
MPRIVIPDSPNWQVRISRAMATIEDGTVLLVSHKQAEKFAVDQVKRRHPDKFVIVQERDTYV